jgi:hypothetical protein
MRWSCPHCGTNLAAADDKVGTGWSFSRCYKCGGFGLVRQAQVNVIKVDKAPAGEKILLPEAEEQPLMSQSAITQMAKHLEASKAGTTAAPIIKNAVTASASTARAGAAVATMATQYPQTQAASLIKAAPRSFTPTESSSPPVLESEFPNALPSEPEVSLLGRVIPYATAVAGMVAIGSGVYLYIHGQALWSKARVALQENNPPNEVVDRIQSGAAAPSRDLGTESSRDGAQRVPSSSRSGLQIRVKSGSASIHQGPGAEYPEVGSAHSEQVLQVVDWSNNWFKVTVPSGAAKKVGWIRSDLVNKLASAEDPGT